MTGYKNYRGTDFSGQDLSGRDFTDGDLRGANFSGATLTGTDLSGANLRGANLSGADLCGARLDNADLAAVRTDATTRLPEGVMLPAAGEHGPKMSFSEKVLSTYMPEGRLIHIPMRRRNYLAVLLDHIVEKSFAAERIYPEKEVNVLLSRFHPDFATLRRLLVDLHYMTRSGGIYRRLVRLSALRGALERDVPSRRSRHFGEESAASRSDPETRE